MKIMCFCKMFLPNFNSVMKFLAREQTFGLHREVGLRLVLFVFLTFCIQKHALAEGQEIPYWDSLHENKILVSRGRLV